MPAAISAAAAAALLGIGKDVVGGAASLIPTQYERANKAELQRLEAARKNGTLGLSSREKDSLRAQRAAPLAAEAQRAQNELQRMSANSGLTGQGLQTQAALATRTAALKDTIEADVQAQDLAEAQRQEEEYWARLVAQSEARKQRMQTAADAASTGIDRYITEDAAKQVREGTVGDRDAARKMGISLRDYQRLAKDAATMAEIEEYLK